MLHHLLHLSAFGRGHRYQGTAEDGDVRVAEEADVGRAVVGVSWRVGRHNQLSKRTWHRLSDREGHQVFPNHQRTVVSLPRLRNEIVHGCRRDPVAGKKDEA